MPSLPYAPSRRRFSSMSCPRSACGKTPTGKKRRRSTAAFCLAAASFSADSEIRCLITVALLLCTAEALSASLYLFMPLSRSPSLSLSLSRSLAIARTEGLRNRERMSMCGAMKHTNNGRQPQVCRPLKLRPARQCPSVLVSTDLSADATAVLSRGCKQGRTASAHS